MLISKKTADGNYEDRDASPDDPDQGQTNIRPLIRATPPFWKNAFSCLFGEFFGVICDS